MALMQIQFRRDTAANWALYNPVLLAGEPALVLDGEPPYFKLGDGKRDFVSLPSLAGLPGSRGEPGIAGPKGDKGEPGERGEAGVQGAKGEKGDTGAQGLQGPPGEAGSGGAGGRLKCWQSGQLPYVKAGIVSVNHGLMIATQECFCDVRLQCIVADNGYMVGDFMSQVTCDMDAWADVPLAPKLNETSISVQMGKNNSGVLGINKAGVEIYPNSNRWRLVFRIWYWEGN